MSHNAAASFEPNNQEGQTSKVTLLILMNASYVHVISSYVISFYTKYLLKQNLWIYSHNVMYTEAKSIDSAVACLL